MTRETAFSAVLLLLGLACGPTIGAETGEGTSETGGSGDSSADASASASADETGAPSGACGENDTELVGGGPPGPLGFPPEGCSPQAEPGVNGYRCCSDDPAAAGGAPPDYQGKNIPSSDTPYFSGDNNDLSTTGQCIRVDDIAGQGLLETAAVNCPIPCNPTWTADVIDSVCGPARVCCQTRELQPEDCIVDESTGLYRPVTGDDIGISTMWRPADHATHQDPNGNGCLALAGGDVNSSVFEDCVRQLTVANQRGLCMALGAGQACPADQPTYIDACEMLNGG